MAMVKRLAILLCSVNLLLAACGATPAAATHPTTTAIVMQTPTVYVTSTLTPPNPAPYVTSTPTLSDLASCNPNIDFINPPGQLPPDISLPPHTLVSAPMAVQAGIEMYNLCTFGASWGPSNSIANFMNTSLAANGWVPYNASDVSYCHNSKFDWYKGNFGIKVLIPGDVFSSGGFDFLPNWAIYFCPYINVPNHT